MEGFRGVKGSTFDDTGENDSMGENHMCMRQNPGTLLVVLEAHLINIYRVMSPLMACSHPMNIPTMHHYAVHYVVSPRFMVDKIPIHKF